MAAPCPSCEQYDGTRSVAAIVEAGQDGWLVPAMSTGPFSDPPIPKERPLLVAAILTAVWLPFAIVLTLVARLHYDQFLLLFGTVPLAYAVYRLWGTHSKKLAAGFRMRDYQAEAERYFAAGKIWRDLQYCTRCNGVFLPGYEWQTVVNPDLRMVAPDHAWSYATSLEQYLWSQQAPVVVSDRGVVGRAR